MSVHLSIRGLSGEKEIEVGENTTVGQLRELGEIAGGLSVRFNGEAVSDDHVVGDQDTLVTTPPAAKHGRR